MRSENLRERIGREREVLGSVDIYRPTEEFACETSGFFNNRKCPAEVRSNLMINGNLTGFGMFIIAGVLIAIGSFVLKLPDRPVMIAGGGLLMIVDLVVRLAKAKNDGWMWRKEFGGVLLFMPVWIFGFVVLFVNLVYLLLGKR